MEKFLDLDTINSFSDMQIHFILTQESFPFGIYNVTQPQFSNGYFTCQIQFGGKHTHILITVYTGQLELRINISPFTIMDYISGFDDRRQHC